MKRKKLRSRGGFTLTEMLCALIVCLLVCAVITTTLQLSSKFLLSGSRDSEAQILCATLATAVKDELRYAEDVVSDASGQVISFFSHHHGEGYRFQSDAAGHLVLVKINGLAEESHPLVGESAYVLDLKAEIEVLHSDMFQVSLRVLDPDGNALAQQDFAVAPLND